MFDIGFWEMSVIALIALVVLGPERLPGLARTAGLWIGRARRMIADVKSDIDREIRNSELKEMESLKNDIEKTGRDLSGKVNEGAGFDKKVADEFDLSDAFQETGNSIKDAAKSADKPRDHAEKS